jgi:diaminohydroxyphosphoribosylaminopyrimidine deaminase/5-amino-6-(5-phosphoribosylamino)uracil reductase
MYIKGKQISMTSDIEYMKEALELARRGVGKTSPNPVVGALLVKNGKIIGRGFHECCGGHHAEINALEEAGDEAQGATLYVTLEPCCTQGKTPPCTEAIIQAGVLRVVSAMKDPNPGVSGKGLAKLEKNGVLVGYGILENEAKKMNEAYEKYITKKTPFVIVKAAMSADGKMAARDGGSKWITGEESRKTVHELRGQVDAIMVGIGTVLADDPSLTARSPGANNPIRIIVDPRLEIPSTAKVLGKDADTIIITSDDAPIRKLDAMRSRGIEVRSEKLKEGKIDLKKLMKDLGREEITSIMIEGGGSLIGSALDAGIVDKVMFFYATNIIGDGVSIGGFGKSLKDSIQLERVEMKQSGEDFLMIGYVSR